MSSRSLLACRVCSSPHLISILDLGDLAVSDFPITNTLADTYPLHLVLCDPRYGCGLLQLNTMGVDQDILYRQYWYKSGVNTSMKRALKEVAVDCQRRMALKSGDVVVDIGANDGTLLSFFPQFLTRVGVEPALNIQRELSLYTSVNVPEYFTKKAYTKYVGTPRAKLITSLAMFYDLDEPVTFVSDLAECLAPDGMWVNQMTYLGSMLEKNDYPNICHEHVTYYSLTTFIEVLRRGGMRLIDVDQNDVNGGSIRTIAVKNDSTMQSSEAASAKIQAVLERERLVGLSKLSTYRAFATTVRRMRRELRTLIREYRRDGKSIAVYGASTKGNTMLQYCGLSYPIITAAFDRNPDKKGRKTVRTNIPIFGEFAMKSQKPDVLLVLPWHFRKEFLRREHQFLQRGGVMIFPLPTLEVVSA